MTRREKVGLMMLLASLAMFFIEFSGPQPSLCVAGFAGALFLTGVGLLVYDPSYYE